MSGKSRRFDEYLPLFVRVDDSRIKLLLGELHDNAINGLAKRPAAKNFVETEFVLTTGNKAIENQYFINRTTDADTAVHPEWKDFILQLANRLGGKSFDDSTKEGKAMLNVVRTLKDAAKQDGSIKQFMLLVLHLIAKFDYKPAAAAAVTGKAFKDFSSELDKVVKVTFEAAHDIINNLTGAVLLTATDDATMLKNGLSLSAVTGLGDLKATTIKALITGGAHKSALEAFIDSKATGATPTIPTAAGKTVDQTLRIVLDEFIASLDKATEFGYNWNKYFRSLLQIAAEQPAPAVPSSFFNDPVVDQGKYWRKADGSLWTMTADGKEEQVDINSKAYNDLTEATCFSTGITKADGSVVDRDVCANYLRTCLAGGDVKQCVAFMKDKDYWQTAQKEIDAMLPPIALKTLEAFGFMTEESYDETNKMPVKKVVEVTAWLAELLNKTKTTPPEISDADYKLIAANDKLMGYLRMLVKKVNTNPSILNKNIVKAAAQPIVDKAAFQGTNLHKMGLTPRIASLPYSTSSIERLGNTIRAEQDAIRIRLLGPALFGGILTGGSQQIDQLEDRLSSETKLTWYGLKAQYMALTEALQGMKKDIAPADKAKIEDLFTSLKRSETKLMQINLMLEKYRELIQIHGVEDNTKTLSVDHLKEFVDNRNKYFMRVAKKQNDLISIIKSISEAVNKESPVKNEMPTESKVKTEKLSLVGLLG